MPLALAGGAWIFLAFLVVAVVVVAFSYYTVKGSGIGQHGWKDRDEVMGATVGKDPSADIRTWTRGTGGPRRRRGMTPLEQRTAEAIDRSAGGDRDPAWRARIGENVQLVAPVSAGRDHVRGPGDAAVTLVEYGEYECRFCKEADEVLARLQERHGDVRLVFRHFPQESVHPHALAAGVAAEAAARQGRFWEQHALMARTKKQLAPGHVRELAGKAGLDVARFESDLADPALEARVREDLRSGFESGVNGTPTLFLNNVRYDDDVEEGELARAIEAARSVAAAAGAGGVR